MQTVSIDSITFKLQVLSDEARNEVYDFIDFLISRGKVKKKKIDKSKLLDLSTWTEEDIQAIENIGKELSRWKIEEL